MARHYCVYGSFSGKGEGWPNLFFMKLSFYFMLSVLFLVPIYYKGRGDTQSFWKFKIVADALNFTYIKGLTFNIKVTPVRYLIYDGHNKE